MAAWCLLRRAARAIFCFTWSSCTPSEYLRVRDFAGSLLTRTNEGDARRPTPHESAQTGPRLSPRRRRRLGSRGRPSASAAPSTARGGAVRRRTAPSETTRSSSGVILGDAGAPTWFEGCPLFERWKTRPRAASLPYQSCARRERAASASQAQGPAREQPLKSRGRSYLLQRCYKRPPPRETEAARRRQRDAAGPPEPPAQRGAF